MRELHLTPSPPSLAQRPTPSSLFYLSHSFPSYRGANTPPPTSVVSITGSSTHPWKIPISTRTSIPAPKPHIRPLKQTSSYCSVEEIKEGKRQRLSCSSSDESKNNRKKGNIYEYTEKGRIYERGNEEEEEDDDGDNYYEKAPNSRPSSAMNLVTVKKQNMPKSHQQQQQKAPAPPALPPPNLSLLSFVRRNEEEMPNGWQRRPSTITTPNRKEEINEKEWKEKIKFKQRNNKTKFLVHILLFALCCSLLLMALPLLLLWFTSPNILNTITPQIINSKQQKNLKNENKIILENNLTKNLFSSFYLNFNKDLSIEPTILAKLILEEEENNPRLRIFEIRSEQIIKDGQKGENHFSQLPGSRHITIESLSHNGVPVHPLQFQRLLRSHSVDSNSIIILYDKHPLGLMSSYALWIFRLYGHNSTFFLNGGASAWHSYLTNKNTNNLLNNSKIEEKLLMTNGGDFRANWREDLVATFDDLLAAFEPTDEGDVSAKVDIVDAQKPEEFDGHIVGGSKSSFSSSSSSTSSISTSPIAIYGHIRTAMNIPVERLFLSTPIGNQRRWASSNAHSRLFARLGLTTKRPVVVYDELSSLRAASVWAALQRANFTASLYFGAWPEWLIRAPDHLKSIPE